MNRKFIFIRDYYPYDELHLTGKYRMDFNGTIYIEVIDRYGPFNLFRFKRWISEHGFQLIEEVEP